ncbi:oligosaccharide flippase family protein [Ramlibacter ginsenosidimutans]|uniref:Oligosaccharide flippase family protein n=1 Tax=Ramlibacter ginsenosidimutans TaxID=502333 RepID=A0A934TSN0_9BURK|nr:oligosaccharide flippase family protein [Ramlibacter ginsenosidimutans]
MSVKKNTALNILGAAAPMAVMLVTVPLYVKILGEARYGVLSLVWLVLGYFSFLELGLGKATANQLAKAAEASAEERSEIFWTAVIVNLAMGAAGGCVLWIAGSTVIDRLPGLAPQFRMESRDALPWLVATFPLALVSSVLNGALEGRSEFFILNVLQVATNTIFQIAPLAVAYWYSPDLGWVIPAAVLSRAGMNFFFLFACWRRVPLQGRPRVSRARLKSLFSYGGWVAVTGIAAPLLETGERMIVGMVLGPAAVTHYTIPMQLVTKAKVLPGALCRALFPSLSSSSAEESSRLAAESACSLAWLLALGCSIGAFALKPFLALWISPEFSRTAAPIGELLLLGVWVTGVAHVPYFYLQARGRPDLIAKLHIIELPLYLLLAWTAAGTTGLTGVAAAWVARGIIESAAMFHLAGMIERRSVQVVWAGITVATACLLTMALDLSLAWRAATICLCCGSALLSVSKRILLIRRATA